MTNDQLRFLEAQLSARSWVIQQRRMEQVYEDQVVLYGEPPLRKVLTLTPDDVTFLRVNGIQPW